MKLEPAAGQTPNHFQILSSKLNLILSKFSRDLTSTLVIIYLNHIFYHKVPIYVYIMVVYLGEGCDNSRSSWLKNLGRTQGIREFARVKVYVVLARLVSSRQRFSLVQAYTLNTHGTKAITKG